MHTPTRGEGVLVFCGEKWITFYQDSICLRRLFGCTNCCTCPLHIVYWGPLYTYMYMYCSKHTVCMCVCIQGRVFRAILQTEKATEWHLSPRWYKSHCCVYVHISDVYLAAGNEGNSLQRKFNGAAHSTGSEWSDNTIYLLTEVINIKDCIIIHVYTINLYTHILHI